MSTYNKYYGLLSPVLKVALVILEAEKEWEDSCGSVDRWHGISHSKIEERLAFDKSIRHYDVSRAQDILLDEGVLYPDDKLIEGTLDGEKCTFWARTYKIVSGEYVRRVLEDIYKSVHSVSD